MPKNALIISGPTACGKSSLAMSLAEKQDIAIINADSLQIYQGLPILSAQPSKEEQKLVEHHLYSHLKPNESCSVSMWLDLARKKVDEVLEAKKLPVIVGGTGMYISKIFEGISPMPQIEEEIIKEAEDFYNKNGKEALQEKLLAAKEKLILDKQRLIRAYCVLLQTGKTISSWQAQENKKLFPDINFTHINIDPDLEEKRSELYDKCNQRFEEMLKNGAIEEVESFIKKENPSDDWPITKTLGFKEIKEYLNKNIAKKEVIDQVAQKTRNYAKRQLTWFRNQMSDKTAFASSRQALEGIDGLVRRWIGQ